MAKNTACYTQSDEIATLSGSEPLACWIEFYKQLGPFDKVLQSYSCGDQGEEAIERFSGLLVLGSNTTELLDPIKHPPDAVSILVGPKVANGRAFRFVFAG